VTLVRRVGLAVVALGGGFLLHCRRAPPTPTEAPAPAASHADEPEHEKLPEKLRLAPEVERDADLKFAKVVRESLLRTVSLPGEVVPDPDRTAKISSPLAGRVERIAVTEGSVVKKGDVIVTLRVPDLGKLRGAHAMTVAKLTAARANEARLKDLFGSNLATEQAYLDAKAEAEALDAQSKALATELAAIGAGGDGPFHLSLRAPIAGTVVARDAIVGQPVGPEKVLATVTDLTEVWFLGRVFEKDLGSLTKGAVADVLLNAFPKAPLPGVLEYLGQQIDPAARTLTARVRLGNPHGTIRLGLFGTARVVVADKEPVPTLVVPRTAVVDVAGRTIVFVRHADGDYEPHEVVVGASAPGKIEIVSGLREGEVVVSQGAFTLKSVMLKGSLKDDD